MFRMFRYFLQIRNPFNTYRFPYNLYSWFFPLIYMFEDMWHWLRHGYPSCFVWGIDTTVAHFILPLLKDLKKNKHGVPSSLLSKDYNETTEELNKAEEQWQLIMSKIIKAFENVRDNVPEELFAQYYKKDLKLAGKLQQQARKEIEEGLALFAKHYQDLWD